MLFGTTKSHTSPVNCINCTVLLIECSPSKRNHLFQRSFSYFIRSPWEELVTLDIGDTNWEFPIRFFSFHITSIRFTWVNIRAASCSVASMFLHQLSFHKIYRMCSFFDWFCHCFEQVRSKSWSVLNLYGWENPKIGWDHLLLIICQSDTKSALTGQTCIIKRG